MHFAAPPSSRSSPSCSPRTTRAGTALVVAALHALAALLLARAFAPDAPRRETSALGAELTVQLAAPPPAPTRTRPAVTRANAAQGAPAPLTVARAISASPPALVLTPPPAPPVAMTGEANLGGASVAGAGTGVSGAGAGPASGGPGTGAGGAARLVKLSGDIDAARDFPPQSRELRLGDYAIVALTVGIDGRVGACRVARASRDPAADQVTCRLATTRFRFRPARDALGNPVPAVFGWKQRWSRPGDDADVPSARGASSHGASGASSMLDH